MLRLIGVQPNMVVVAAAAVVELKRNYGLMMCAQNKLSKLGFTRNITINQSFTLPNVGNHL